MIFNLPSINNVDIKVVSFETEDIMMLSRTCTTVTKYLSEMGSVEEYKNNGYKVLGVVGAEAHHGGVIVGSLSIKEYSLIDVTLSCNVYNVTDSNITSKLYFDILMIKDEMVS